MKKNSDLFRDKCKMEYDNLVDITSSIKGHYIYKIKLKRNIIKLYSFPKRSCYKKNSI